MLSRGASAGEPRSRSDLIATPPPEDGPFYDFNQGPRVLYAASLSPPPKIWSTQRTDSP